MKVYSSSGFINAGSSVNGTADRYKYTATASQTTFTGADDNGNTLAYDAGFLDVYLNGIKLVNGSDFTASSGTSIVLTVGASASDILEVIAYGTFQLANFSIADANDVPALGTAGQVLKVNSGATALEYGTIDLTNLNASNLTSGTVSTARLGSGTANSTNFLRGDGTWSSAGTSWQSVQTSGFTAVAGRGYPCNTTSAAFTVTLPATPSVGDTIILLDYAGTFATNNITLGANSNKINGVVANKLLTTSREATTLVYVDATQGWVASSGVNEGTAPSLTPVPYSVDFLVIAGGGGGAGQSGAPGPGAGGGGAGGYRNSFSTETSGGGGSSEATLTFTGGTVYTITVGGGGAGGPADGNSPGTPGTTGTNSSISGTGITTITSSGGGGGAGRNANGVAGGSGGGGGGGTSPVQTGGAGTANQGYAGGSSVSQGAGGGGGSGAIGSNAVSPSTGGDGGNGLASSITGSSVTRAGGGGGGGITGGSAGSGGAGAGGGTAGNGSAATVNTGSGGGGGGISTTTGGAGGKGVVILRMPTANYSGTTTGSPTVTTLVFNDSGTITG
jgi:hypothetical protein